MLNILHHNYDVDCIVSNLKKFLSQESYKFGDPRDRSSFKSNFTLLAVRIATQ